MLIILRWSTKHANFGAFWGRRCNTPLKMYSFWFNFQPYLSSFGWSSNYMKICKMYWFKIEFLNDYLNRYFMQIDPYDFPLKINLYQRIRTDWKWIGNQSNSVIVFWELKVILWMTVQTEKRKENWNKKTNKNNENISPSSRSCQVKLAVDFLLR